MVFHPALCIHAAIVFDIDKKAQDFRLSRITQPQRDSCAACGDSDQLDFFGPECYKFNQPRIGNRCADDIRVHLNELRSPHRNFQFRFGLCDAVNQAIHLLSREHVHGMSPAHSATLRLAVRNTRDNQPQEDRKKSCVLQPHHQTKTCCLFEILFH